MQPGWRCGLSLSGGARASQRSAGGAWAIAHVQGKVPLTQCSPVCSFNWAQALGTGHTTTMSNTFPEVGLFLERDTVPSRLLIFICKPR